MPYVLEGISLYENDEIKQTNLVVKDSLFYSRDLSVTYLKYIRLQMDKYIMIAGETAFGSLETYKENPMEYTTKMILLGATTIIFPVDVSYEYQLKQAFKSARQALTDFPLDYVFVLQIPLPLLRPSIVRYCRQHYIPGIITKIHDVSSIQSIPISWIRDAAFPYKIVFIPQFSSNEKDQQRMNWNGLFQNMQLAYVEDQIALHQYLPKKIVKMLGIYPHKGILRTGGEVTYNVIHEEDQTTLMSQKKLYHDKILYTVFKNKVIRAGTACFIPSEKGKELVIKVPGFFQ